MHDPRVTFTRGDVERCQPLAIALVDDERSFIGVEQLASGVIAAVSVIMKCLISWMFRFLINDLGPALGYYFVWWKIIMYRAQEHGVRVVCRLISLQYSGLKGIQVYLSQNSNDAVTPKTELSIERSFQGIPSFIQPVFTGR